MRWRLERQGRSSAARPRRRASRAAPRALRARDAAARARRRRGGRHRGRSPAEAWKPPPPELRLLADVAARWVESCLTRGRATAVRSTGAARRGGRDPPRARAHARAARPANEDLHAGNVLRATREPWLVIDPKPIAAEREFTPVAMVRDRKRTCSPARSRGAASAPARPAVSVDLELDRERVRGWTVAHTLAWGFEKPRRLPRPSTRRRARAAARSLGRYFHRLQLAANLTVLVLRRMDVDVRLPGSNQLEVLARRCALSAHARSCMGNTGRTGPCPAPRANGPWWMCALRARPVSFVKVSFHVRATRPYGLRWQHGRSR